MWNRDCLWDHKQQPNFDEIPMWNRDCLWDHKQKPKCDEIPMRERDKYGNAMKIAFMMKFRCEIETIMEMQMDMHL